MTLQATIQSIEGWQTKTNAELLTLVQATKLTSTDSQLYTYAGLILILGEEAGLGFRATLKYLTQPSNPANLTTKQFEGLDFAHARLEGPGIDLSLPSVQATLDSLTAIPQLAPLIPIIKAIGVQVFVPYETTTLAEVSDAVAEMTLQAKKDDWKIRFDAALNQLGTVENAQGVAAIEAIAGEVA